MMRFTRPLRNLSFFLFLLLGLTPWARGGQLVDRTVVTINNEVILESDIDKFKKKLNSKSYQELLGIDQKLLNERENVLQLLVEEKLINQQVKKLDLAATDQEVDGQVRAILKRNGITKAQLGERLKQLGTTMDDYREGLKRQVERRNLVDREIRPTLEITEEQLRRFYQRNARGGELNYRIAHILIQEKPGAAARANKVYAEAAANPAAFDKLTKDYSDDTSTAESGGQLGEYAASQLSNEFRKVIPKTPVGGITKPIKTSAGFHIVKVLDSKAGGFSTLSKEQKQSLRDQMISQELQSKMAMWLERKKAEAHIQRFPVKKP